MISFDDDSICVTGRPMCADALHDIVAFELKMQINERLNTFTTTVPIDLLFSAVVTPQPFLENGDGMFCVDLLYGR